jgi:VCBS repeat-containing protein
VNYVSKFDAKISVDGLGSHANGDAHVHTISPHTTHAPADAIVVSDAHLLFNGDFKRSGVDLILSAEDQKLVLHDYFKGEKRAALASPDGAHLTGDIVKALSGYVEYVQADGSASANKVIGHVTKLAGAATAIRNGVSINLNQGDNVEKGDVLQSGSGSTLGVTFIDGTVFGLSSNARMVLNEMVYDPNGSNNSSLLSLVAGTITFVAGETAKHGDMKIDTPVATMGIRGTAVLVEIDFDVAGQNGLPDAKFQVLVEPGGTTGSYVLFDKTTLTQLAIVDTAGQQINISNGSITQSQSGLSSDQQQLITDVFALKFTDLFNSNPKTSTAQNDTITPQSQGLAFKLADGTSVFATVFIVNTTDKSAAIGANGSGPASAHIDLPPTVVALGGSIEAAGTKNGLAIDTVSGRVSFADVNAADRPTVTVTFGSFTLQDAQHHDITSALTSQQLAAITAVETSLVLIPAPGNNNNGSVTWTYSVPDKDFAFLLPGETLTLTYLAEVDTNYSVYNAAVVTPITLTITGHELPTVTATSSSITELPGSNNATIDHAGGSIVFTNALPAAVSTLFTSFTYEDASHHDVTSSLTPAQSAAITAIEASIELTPSGNGSLAWSYDVADSKLDFLAAGEILTLTYTAKVDDGQGGTVAQPFTVTITGTNDVPTITTTSASFTELPGTNNVVLDHAGGTITFTDADLTDHPLVSTQFSSFTYENAAHNNITSTLTAEQQADIAAVEASLQLTPSATNANNGSVGWSYDVSDSKFDFLAAGDTLALTYIAAVDDGHGGLASEPLTVTIAGTNDTPLILGEANPPIQAVIVAGSGAPMILDQGVNTNSLGLNTETFDSQQAGSASNSGEGFGNFYSAALDATFSGSGEAGVVNGSSGLVDAAPFVGPFPGSADTTNYLSINQATETITFAHEEDSFGLYVGSLDSFNMIKFFDGTTLVASYTGADLSPLVANGSTNSFTSAGYVEFSGLGPFDKVVLQSTSNSFEIDNVSAGFIHPQLAAPIAGTLSVSDADIGDTLTASVTGNATIEYNGSTTLPANADIDALVAASNIKFDSVTSNGGTEVLDWTYNPTDPDLEFLQAGDTLTVSYTAQVNDGNGSVGNQPLTITIVGADKSANISAFQVVSGTSQNDTFNNVGNGVSVFGGGGNDTFVFNAGFGSATIGDFNVDKNTIDISHTLFASVSAILASAQSINSGHDTVLTDAAHDTITLVGVTVAQVQAHAGDFHLV